MSNKQRRFRIPKNPISLVLFLWSHNRFLQKLSLHPDSFRSPFLLHRRNEHPQSHTSNQQISDLSLTLCFHPHIASLVQTLPQILLKQLINHRSTLYPSVLPTSLAALCTRQTVGTWNTPQSRSLPAKPTRSTSNPASTRPCVPWLPRDSASCARRERTSRWGSSRGAGRRGRRGSRRWATGRRWRGREDLNRSLFLSRVERSEKQYAKLEGRNRIVGLVLESNGLEISEGWKNVPFAQNRTEPFPSSSSWFPNSLFVEIRINNYLIVFLSNSFLSFITSVIGIEDGRKITNSSCDLVSETSATKPL